MISLLMIFMFGLVITGCNTSVSDRTDMYGTLVYDNPDSLLQVVTRIDTSAMSIDERQRYNLMYTAAMYRTGMFIEDTSLINACEEYYTEKEDRELMALSKLYHAENAYHQFDYYKAVSKTMDALNILQDVDNYPLKYNLLNLLYRINVETECYDRATDACLKAAEYAEKGGLVNQMAEARNYLAAMLIEQNKMDEAESILKRNYDVTDRRIESEYFRIKGVYLLKKDSIVAARDMLKRAETLLPTSETFYNIASLYLKTHSTDSCLNYCHFAITADKRGYVSTKAYSIITENFSNQLGISTLRRICAEMNRLYLKRAGTGNAIKMNELQSAYDKEEGSVVPWIIAVLLAASVVAVIYIKKRKTSVNGDVMLINENIVYELHKLSAQGKMPSQEQWIMLHGAANKHIPFFLERLHKVIDLSARDVNICLLTRLHFSPSEIAVLNDISAQSVTNTRARLLTKIFGVKGGAAEFDKRIKAIQS